MRSLGGGTGLALLLLAAGACGSGTADPVPGDSGASNGARPATTAECRPGETDGELVISNWSDFIDPELLVTFEQEHGASVTLEEHTSNEEVLEAFRRGDPGHDLVVLSDYMVRIMREEGLLLALDPDAIRHRSNIAAAFADPPYDPDNRFSIPYQWGTTGIGVDTDVVGEDVEASWGLVFDRDVASRHGGRITLLDDARETMAAALSHLGHPPNTADEEELREAAALVADARERGATFVSEGYTDLLFSGEVAIAHGFSSDHIAAAARRSEDRGRYRYLVPAEGATMWVDAMAIPLDASHPCTAHTFIDFLLVPEHGAQLTNWNYYASPNAAAEEHILPEIRQDEGIYPPAGTKLFFLEDVGAASALYRDLFAEATR